MLPLKFTLRHTFDNIVQSRMNGISPREVHFGLPWCITIVNRSRQLGIFLNFCRREDKENPWSISAEAIFRMKIGKEVEKIEAFCKVKFPNQLQGIRSFCNWDTMIESYVTNGELSLEIDVTITDIKGIAPRLRQRNFDEPRKHMTDVVLIVGDRRFHVSKVILAEFSDYFASLFFNGCKETNQSEITLEAVDPDAFQMLLEVIYNKPECIQVKTVEDILLLARQYQVECVTKRCVEFVIHNEMMDNDHLYRLASEYNLSDLQDHLVERIETSDDADKVLKRKIQQLDDAFVAKIMRKVYSKQ